MLEHTALLDICGFDARSGNSAQTAIRTTYGLIEKADLSAYPSINLWWGFDDSSTPVYLDVVHSSDTGNRMIASEIARPILGDLSQQTTGLPN